MEQREITFPVSLLDRDGRLLHSGYSREMKLRYRRKDVKTPLRLKEWDSYLIFGGGVTLRVTVCDRGFTGTDSVELLTAERTAGMSFSSLTPGGRKLPEQSTEGDICVTARDHSLHLLHTAPGERTLIVQIRNFDGEGSLSARLRVFGEPAESMTLSAPLEKGFSYNQRIVGFRAEGYIRWAGETWELDGGECRAVLDWERGVWPRQSGWTWCCAAGEDADGVPFGFSLGESPRNGGDATENVLFSDGVGHKLGAVTVTLPEGEEPWRIADDEGRAELVFVPESQRITRKKRLTSSEEHRILRGTFSGRVTLDDGRTMEVRDVPGCAEKAELTW